MNKKSNNVSAFLFLIFISLFFIFLFFIFSDKSKNVKSKDNEPKKNDILIINKKEIKEITETKSAFKEIKIINNGALDLKINKINSGENNSSKILEKIKNECSKTFVFHSKSSC